MYDLLIKGGKIVDGSGNPWYHGDVAIKGRIISAIGDIGSEACETIDASGLVVAPGFIDSHSHSDLVIMSEPEARMKIMQGITTEVIGQDGLGEAPLRSEVIDMWRRYLSGLNGDPQIEWNWRNFGEYLAKIEAAKPSVNIAALIGHGNLRLLAMGMEDRKPRPQELQIMKELLDESLKDGAVGLSTGLVYPPCVYADSAELTELCKVVSTHRGVFVVHMRNEGDQLLNSIHEVVSIGRDSGVPVHISHFKSAGKNNFGNAPKALNKVMDARRGGVDVTFDQYPYTAGSTFLSSLLPPWAHDGGLDKFFERLSDEEIRKRLLYHLNELGDEGSPNDWDRILITNVKTIQNKRFEGKFLSEIAAELRKSPAEALLDLVLAEDNAVTMANFTMQEDDVRAIMQSPLEMVCTDGIVLGKPHPRVYGSFPRVLGRYVREKILSQEEAIRRMTSHPAQRFGLYDRGILRPGLAADVTVFDPENIEDTATYEDPTQYPKGIEYVIVNGVVTINRGKHNGERRGLVLKHNRVSKWCD